MLAKNSNRRARFKDGCVHRSRLCCLAVVSVMPPSILLSLLGVECQAWGKLTIYMRLCAAETKCWRRWSPVVPAAAGETKIFPRGRHIWRPMYRTAQSPSPSMLSQCRVASWVSGSEWTLNHTAATNAAALRLSLFALVKVVHRPSPLQSSAFSASPSAQYVFPLVALQCQDAWKSH